MFTLITALPTVRRPAGAVACIGELWLVRGAPPLILSQQYILLDAPNSGPLLFLSPHYVRIPCGALTGVIDFTPGAIEYYMLVRLTIRSTLHFSTQLNNFASRLRRAAEAMVSELPYASLLRCLLAGRVTRIILALGVLSL